MIQSEVRLPLKTYIIQFIYPKGNGWAFVNATMVSQAEKVFYNQTKYEDTKITSIKETKWYGSNIQLVYEGAVTTCANINVSVSLSDLINNSDAFESVEEYLNSIFNFDNYYTKDETNTTIENRLREFVESGVIPTLDLSEYVKKTELKDEIDSAIQELDIHDGEPGPEGPQGPEGPAGPQGNPGADGVGISSITYTRSTVSGGRNILRITLTDGRVITGEILNGIDGQGGGKPAQIETVEVLSLYRGNIETAKARASANQTTMFQYILDSVDRQGNPFTKVIWYTGDGKFIDALGSVIATITLT